jgi:hypothetical protein
LFAPQTWHEILLASAGRVSGNAACRYKTLPAKWLNFDLSSFF